MAFNYANIAATAISQISDKGRNVTYRTIGSGTYDPSNGSISLESTSDTTVKSVVTEVNIDTKDDSALQRGDKVFLIAGITPNKKDRIIDEGKTYQIMAIQTIKTGDTAIMYKIQGRV